MKAPRRAALGELVRERTLTGRGVVFIFWANTTILFNSHVLNCQNFLYLLQSGVDEGKVMPGLEDFKKRRGNRTGTSIS
jgi:hypothetical protein